jgi:uncharacterized protein (DUF58 family)
MKPRDIQWGEYAPLRITSRMLADGLLTGLHASAKRGSGMEFAGHRPYVEGDELRRIDAKASMRTNRLLVRTFQTETERPLHVILDASESMSFRGGRAPCDKFAFAAVLAAVLARLALFQGDPVSFTPLFGSNVRAIPVSARGEQFEAILANLEAAKIGGDAREHSKTWLETISHVAIRAAAGSTIVLLSDLLDLPDEADSVVAALGSRGRALAIVQTIDAEESAFPYEGPVQLMPFERAPGDPAKVTVDANSARSGYLARFAGLRDSFATATRALGGVFVQATTDQRPVEVVRALLAALEHRR